MFGITRKKQSYATPIQAAGYGAAAGFAATVLITILAHSIPVMKENPNQKRKPQKTKLPEDPFDPEEVQKWQDRTRSPAVYSNLGDAHKQGTAVEHAATVTPAGALAQSQGAGPEGAAQNFVAKLGSGLFDRDISDSASTAGEVLHFVYGSFWGIVYGLLQGKRRRNRWVAGTSHGLFVWAFGPGSLVPAMHLTPPVTKAPKIQTALMIAGHLIYGLTISTLFDAQMRRRK